MTTVNLQQWMEHPEMLNRESLYELRNLLARYPYFSTLRLLYLKNLYILHDANFGAELRKSVLYIADRRKLFYLIEGERFAVVALPDAPKTMSIEQEEEPSIDRTLALIDAFLSTASEETERIPLDYSMDYASYLLTDIPDVDAEQPADAQPMLKGHELIDDFIDKSEKDTVLPPKQPTPKPAETDETASETASEADDDDSCFTETLAKIYIRQHRYSKALEIIKKLSLKYPKKNTYFADQIRFLEKLIINANSK